MFSTALARGAALCILAGFFSAGSANAGGGKMFTGLGEVGYAHNEYDSDLIGEFDSRTIHAAGSAHWAWPNMWNAQANFNFSGEKVDASPVDLAVDTYRLGMAGFYRDQMGLLGAEINYQSVDIGIATSGFNVAGRGEYFWPEGTVGGGVAYSDFDDDVLDITGWDLGLYGKYYFTPDLGVTVGATYNMWESDSILISDVDGWSLRGELEYLIPDCATSIFAGLEFGDFEFDLANAETDFFSFGFGARVYFDTDGRLQKRHRTGAIQQLDLNPRLSF